MIDIDVTQLDALSRLGVVAFFVLLTILWLRGAIITHREKQEAEEGFRQRLGDKDEQLIEYKQLVKGLTRRLDRMQGVLEKITGIPVPPDPDEDS